MEMVEAVQVAMKGLGLPLKEAKRLKEPQGKCFGPDTAMSLSILS